MILGDHRAGLSAQHLQATADKGAIHQTHPEDGES
jgi:hypothetical protein